MANWMTVADISARYIVGEQKLLAYASRGNMPMFRRPDGTTLFDESFAAQLFRPRNPAAVAPVTAASDKPNLGLLGAIRLGAQPDEAPRSMRIPAPSASPPEPTRTRRRAVRSAALPDQPDERMRKAAG